MLSISMVAFYTCILLITFSRLSWWWFCWLLIVFTFAYFAVRLWLKFNKAVASWLPKFVQRKFCSSNLLQPRPIVVDKCEEQVYQSGYDDNPGDDVSISSACQCFVCGDYQCNRHSEDCLIQLQPWKGIYLDECVNKELELLLNTILNQYVQSWYKELAIYRKNDQKFDRELRYLIKHVIAVCIKRLRLINLKKIITVKLLPLLIQHFHAYLNGKRTAKAQLFIERSVLREYHELGLFQAHIRSEQEEIKWLRNFSELLLPYLLPPKLIYSNMSRSFVREILACAIMKPAVTIISDPFYVNEILTMIFDIDMGTMPIDQFVYLDERKPEIVQLLDNFIHDPSQATHGNNSKAKCNISDSALGIELKNLLRDQQMLFLFLRFLKEEGCVNLLQFILTIDSFNEKILNPDLNENDRKELYADALQICRTYFMPSGCDFIGFRQENWLQELQTILDKGTDHVEDLRKTDILFKAYDQVYAVLENNFLPLFFESEIYLKLIVGPRIQPTCLDSNSNERTLFLEATPTLHLPTSDDGGSTVGSIEIDDKLSESDLDEDNTSIDVNQKEDDYIFDYGIDLIDIIDNNDGLSDSEQQRKEAELKDLSTWRVSIEKVDTKLEHNSFKYFYVYVLRVTQTDTFDDAYSVNEGAIFDEMLDKQLLDQTMKEHSVSWTVERKYDEFYVLDEKLKKFHGNALNSIAGLSSKRTLFKQSLAFLETRRREFEKYVQDLLTLTHLQRSELLYNFLKPATSKKQQDIFNSKLMAINIKKMIKTVPAKFSQEKGQHLENFLSSFICSTEAQKIRGNVPDLKDIFNCAEDGKEDQETSNQDYLFFDCLSPFGLHRAGSKLSNFTSKWVYDYFVYFLTRICFVRGFFSRCMLHGLKLLQPFLRQTVEHFFSLFIDCKLEELLTAPNFALGLQYIRQSFEFLDSQSITSENNQQPSFTVHSQASVQTKSKESLAAMQKYFAATFGFIGSAHGQQENVYFLHSVFQHSMLNKQLFYLMFSLVLEDLFPEVLDRKV